MKSTRFEKQVTIKADKQKVWDVIADFGNVSRTSPNLVKSYLTSEQQSGVGTTRHCDFAAMGATVEERIIEWNEGESLKIDIYERKNMPMIADMKAEFKITSDEDGTVLFGGFEYQMSNAVGNMFNSLGMKKMNEKAWTDFLAGIKHHVETGEVVDKRTALDTAMVMDVAAI